MKQIVKSIFKGIKDPDLDPHFYEVKKALRKEIPDAQMIAIHSIDVDGKANTSFPEVVIVKQHKTFYYQMAA